MNATDLEREYSPSSRLPDGDYQPFIEAYRRGSQRSWSELVDADGVNLATIDYGAPGDPFSDSQTIDVASPRVEGGLPPLLVFFHGGYWQALSKMESRFAAADCVGRGWAFAAVDYTLAPAASLDQIVEQCRRATRTLIAEAPSLGFDPGRIVVAGSSAGAHLGAMVAADPELGRRLAGAVLVSGVFELEPLMLTSVNDALGLDQAAVARNSPLRFDLERFPSTVLVHGSNETEEFKAQTDAFAGHLEASGTSVVSAEVAGRNHFDVVLDLARPNTVLGDAVAGLIDRGGGARADR